MAKMKCFDGGTLVLCGYIHFGLVQRFTLDKRFHYRKGYIYTRQIESLIQQLISEACAIISMTHECLAYSWRCVHNLKPSPLVNMVLGEHIISSRSWKIQNISVPYIWPYSAASSLVINNQEGDGLLLPCSNNSVLWCFVANSVTSGWKLFSLTLGSCAVQNISNKTSVAFAWYQRTDNYSIWNWTVFNEFLFAIKNAMFI